MQYFYYFLFSNSVNSPRPRPHILNTSRYPILTYGINATDFLIDRIGVDSVNYYIHIRSVEE